MGKKLFLALLFCMAVAGIADAGQFRISPPGNLRKRQPPPNYRASRLEIVNNDDRGYAIDVDYKRNRLEFEHRAKGDVYIPANSKITLVFDDDDDWRIYGDKGFLNIQIRAGRTTTLKLETKKSKHQVGLFGTVEEGKRQRTAQLFKYADRKKELPGGKRPGQQPSLPGKAPHGGPPDRPLGAGHGRGR